LTITIIEGEGAINNIKSRVAREPIVEVDDENHKPVAGAIVTFTMPNSGPGGTFLNGSRVLTVTTGQDGRATATGLRSNNQKGQYQIHVLASIAGVVATAVITQSVAGGGAAGGSSGGGLFGLGIPLTVVIVGGLAAGTATGLALGLGGGGTRTARISVGPPSLP
jgi:hypothetical protein